MGASIECRDGRLPPLRIEGASLSGIEYELPVASAQVKSCLLLAGLLADGETRIVEPAPSRDHSERMLAAAGAEVGRDGDAVTIRPAAALAPGRIAVPGDISAAAFFIVGATVVPGSDLALTGVGLNPTRTGLLGILGRMGAAIEVEEADATGEPSGSLRVGAAELRGTEVGGDEVPLAIDELPLVALAACFAEGETRIRDAAELRRKESDRIATVCEALAALGGDVEASEDGARRARHGRPARGRRRLPRRPQDRDDGRDRRPRLARGGRGRRDGRCGDQLPGLRGRPRRPCRQTVKPDRKECRWSTSRFATSAAARSR